MDLRYWIDKALTAHEKWAAEFGAFTPHSSMRVDDASLGTALERLQDRLRDNYPFFHPRYAGQMLKPPHPVAIVGYLSAMLINPNNHALDGGPATAKMEREVVAQLAAMFGYPAEHLGHLTSSGTIANLEALFVARELHPGRGVAYSAEAHYTHSRMCGVLGMRGYSVPADGRGRMDLDALEDLLRTGEVGTVVLTPGTTALGAIEPVHEALQLRERYGVRIHIDGAYGGFFTLLAGTELDPEPWRAIAEADSIVVDPHKHGLQPYGCGAVLFRDPSVGRYYLHDSPYTYFTSDELHLGEISLECSRAGAAAAGLWLTFQMLPPTREGLGEVLAAGRRAAVRWASMISASDDLELYQEPELDIVSYFPRTSPLALSAIDEASNRIMHDGMTAADPVFLSVARASAAAFESRHPSVVADADGARVLRSVLMKPESEDFLDTLHQRVLELTRGR
ncbi:aspartate aminotransferase family protein [Lentzea sp. NBRC 105346]|uniref:pyridoxal phosphate-dependent decarboxylase family protein n=1 Tax=Lentzea sp. NBRC 105346 TaxID=3032205 RepID=UPI0024A4BC82|nr:aminotransferase class V-fold PLP-dependent enzyme [Lentzea sp. NBRC 105346]GLZ28816.1 aspartate aminotransferase family protein [Lentzea sp. NBRC 105346]